MARQIELVARSCPPWGQPRRFPDLRAALLDHLVGTGEQHGRHFEAGRFFRSDWSPLPILGF
jgi:hypothetical protein